MVQQTPYSEVQDVYDMLECLIRMQSSDSGSTSTLEALIELGAPTVSVAILDAGTVTTKVIGSPPQANSSTLFQATSISKPLTSLAIQTLCQNRILSLTTPISQHLSKEQLSWISSRKTYHLVKNMVLSQLLSITSGLSCTGFSGYSSSPLPTIEQILTGSEPASNEPVTMTLMPGTRFSCSGGGIHCYPAHPRDCLGEAI